jgi:hypothetical protein
VSATSVLAKTTTTVPLVVDDVGHLLGGGEWGAVRASTGIVEALEAAGSLVQVTVADPSSAAPEVQAALVDVDRLNERAGAAEQLEPEALGRLLEVDLRVPGSPGKGGLVELAARSTVKIPTPAAARRQSA